MLSVDGDAVRVAQEKSEPFLFEAVFRRKAVHRALPEKICDYGTVKMVDMVADKKSRLVQCQPVAGFSVLEMDFRTEQDCRKAEDDCSENPAGFKIFAVSHGSCFYGSTKGPGRSKF